MQVKRIDGQYDKPIPYEEGKMKAALENPNVEHVEVFKATPEELAKRAKLLQIRSHLNNRDPKVKKRRGKNKQSKKSRISNKRK